MSGYLLDKIKYKRNLLMSSKLKDLNFATAAFQKVHFGKFFHLNP
jgi:hypothetical protein